MAREAQWHGPGADRLPANRMTELYDRIGHNYGIYRKPDPRIARALAQALGDADPVVNVGAGAGSYEPAGRHVVAVEPSLEMIRQRPAGRGPVVRASATHLPFPDGAFAAAMAVLTVHHWPDRALGLAEMARVASRRVAILTWDPMAPPFWLVADYFPRIGEVDRGTFPSLDDLRRVLGPVSVEPVLIPRDCTDGFLGAYWGRPRAYLDGGARLAISAFSRIGDVGPGLARLERDLADGTWECRYGSLLERTELDLGYRLVVLDRPGSGRTRVSS